MFKEQVLVHLLFQLSFKEHERMEELAEEWKQRDLEREMVMKRKIQEYTALEGSLKKVVCCNFMFFQYLFPNFVC